MIITYEFDTDAENFDWCEYEQVKSASNMACALWDISQAVRDWYKYNPDSLTPDTLHDKFYEILSDNDINIERIMR